MAAGARDIRDRLEKLLECADHARASAELDLLPAQALAAALPAYLCSANPDVKWRAVDTMGCAVARLAHQDMEAARRAMRRLFWSLNHESGGMGWGAAEALGEIIARHDLLSREFGPLLAALLHEDAYHLQFAPPALLRGALWAVCRAAAARPGLLHDAGAQLIPLLQAADPDTRAQAARALGLIHDANAVNPLSLLVSDDTPAVIEGPGGPQATTVAREAAHALDLIHSSS